MEKTVHRRAGKSVRHYEHPDAGRNRKLQDRKSGNGSKTEESDPRYAVRRKNGILLFFETTRSKSGRKGL